MRYGWMKLALTVAVIALLTGGAALYLRQDREQLPASAPPQPIPVIATTVQQRDVPIVLTGLGTVAALNTATVQSQVTGQLVSVDFKEGQFVKKGDLLGQIDPRTYQAQLDEAEATLAHDQVHLKNGEVNRPPSMSSMRRSRMTSLRSNTPRLSSVIPDLSPRSMASRESACSMSAI
jgi:membrane fusion protein, multidrug efflux system